MHKGVETPHVQQSLPNIDKEGKIHYNKDRKTVESMAQEDIITIKRVLKIA
ncbi:polymorphic toxin type 24 domain-containing protein [Flectobacillus roseus]|uniref:Polymorphic toxin type 24 domain-containing protein n=1 Tax=Flectobacillus roseus TaxID=502259 RepID=A0ABT6Y2D1_9BACT|nr:polymorphic toxin type 24 domain-containing protein [Flectobacillus roseus]MDI9857719.1 polymorphic toxin type 24 domain-containing protein [Flectobacillus roseus]